MNRNKGLIITLCIMCLSAAVLWAMARLSPAILIYILGVFSVPGFLACGYVLFVWVITPEAKRCLPRSRKESSI